MKIKTMEPLEQVRDLTANVTNEKKTHPLKRKDQNIELSRKHETTQLEK